jgi:hypothetical protein
LNLNPSDRDKSIERRKWLASATKMGVGRMRKTLQLAAALSIAAALALPAGAEEHHGGGAPGGGHPGPGAGRPGPGHSGGGFHGHHNIGERGYSFHVGGPGRREIRFFSPREHELWRGGHWHHEVRFGRLGYWYEVDGAWYFYDRPFDGPPTYVSEVEFFDPDLGPPAVVAPAPVVVAPAPVVVVPPAVCVGPLCIR